MRHTFRRLRFIVGFAAIGGCSSSLHVGPLTFSRDADTELMPASAAGRRADAESPTTSFALDRLAKRTAQLTGTVRRIGSGRGVSIYVFDGGIADHPELAGRVRTGFDAFPSTPRVCDSHGLAVASAAAGKTLGVAPDAEVIDVKIMNCARSAGTVDAIVAAARWTVEDHRRHPDRPAIANWSFVVDTTVRVAKIDSAIALLRDAGILVVASAGNADIDACRVSPANSGQSLVVGAASLLSIAQPSGRSLLRDVRTPNTAWGDCIDLYAPGELVPLATVEKDKPSVTSWTGTSMAAGYVSGAASLLLEEFPWMPPAEVSRMLIERSTPSIVDEGLTRAPTRMRKPLLYLGPPDR